MMPKSHPVLSNKTAVVALSGGVDSVVLLHYLCHQTQHSIRAIHINHHLSPKADSWAKFCQQLCQTNHLSLTTIDILLDDNKNLEKNARDKRYQALFSQLNKDEILCTAHHQNDQAETLLLQLLRGAGVAGLAGMPILKGQHYRPFLDWHQEDIIAYANKHHLQWVEDDSNKETYFRRNFLRLKILPLLKTVFKNPIKTLCRSAQHQAQTLILLRELAQNDIKQYRLLDADNRLDITVLKLLSKHRLHNVFRYYFYQKDIIVPSTKRLNQISHQLLHAKADAKILIQWQGYKLRRYQHKVYCEQNDNPPVCPLTQHLNSNTAVEIRYNQPVKRVIIAGKTHSQLLKKIYQEKKIPPWQRQQLAMYYQNNQLIAISNIGVLRQKL